MAQQTTRREILKGGLAAAGLGMLGIPEWALPALAQGETLVPFTDLPENINLVPTPERRIIDIRYINGLLTPRDTFPTTQHYGHPTVDPVTYRLNVTGLVDKPLSLSLDDLKRMRSTDIVFGFECSGNRRPLQGLTGNGRWTGVSLKRVLDEAGVQDKAHEFVFFGADHGEEEVDFRGTVSKLDQQFGRSLKREDALSGEPILAYAMNGEPLTRHQGFPLRLIIPGWYGISNVKWLAGIHAQEDEFLGKWQARWFRTVRGEMIAGQMHWTEKAISRLQLKSFIARVSKAGDHHNVFGIILHDGTPLRSVEVKVDNGPWQPATIDPATSKEKYSWKQFNYVWRGATPGAHALVSRVTDVNGKVQPTVEDLANKKSFLEDNSQHERKILIA
jgi:DMSO/TMAO reductase YedYZ molybdopterin-dependent catalytic subunit